jgi:methylase of polypeptide subunit release factors
MALSGGVDGLDVFRALISQAPIFLKDRGYIFLK